MMRFSFSNYAAAATVTTSSADPNYPAANAKTPERPFKPARTATTGDQWWTFDLGSSKSIAVWGIIRANFSSVRIQANASDSWGAPAYDSGLLTLTRNPYNGRYQYGLRPTSPQVFRYTRLFVPTQGTVDGAPYYLLGGLWAGDLASPPRDIRWNYHVTTGQPRQDRTPDHKGWLQRISMGDPLTQIRADRQALTGLVSQGKSPGFNDDVAAWFDVERQWELVDFALVTLRDDNPALTWVMRRMNVPEWDIDFSVSESNSLELQEAMR